MKFANEEDRPIMGPLTLPMSPDRYRAMFGITSLPIPQSKLGEVLREIAQRRPL